MRTLLQFHIIKLEGTDCSLVNIFVQLVIRDCCTNQWQQLNITWRPSFAIICAICAGHCDQTECWFRDSPCSLTLRRLEESEQTSTVHPVLQTGSPAGADLCLRTVDTHLGSQYPVPPCNTTAGDTWHHLEEKIVSFHGSFLTLKVIVYIFHRWQDETNSLSPVWSRGDVILAVCPCTRVGKLSI